MRDEYFSNWKNIYTWIVAKNILRNQEVTKDIKGMAAEFQACAPEGEAPKKLQRYIRSLYARELNRQELDNKGFALEHALLAETYKREVSWEEIANAFFVWVADDAKPRKLDKLKHGLQF